MSKAEFVEKLAESGAIGRIAGAIERDEEHLRFDEILEGWGANLSKRNFGGRNTVADTTESMPGYVSREPETHRVGLGLGAGQSFANALKGERAMGAPIVQKGALSADVSSAGALDGQFNVDRAGRLSVLVPEDASPERRQALLQAASITRDVVTDPSALAALRDAGFGGLGSTQMWRALDRGGPYIGKVPEKMWSAIARGAHGMTTDNPALRAEMTPALERLATTPSAQTIQQQLEAGVVRMREMLKSAT